MPDRRNLSPEELNHALWPDADTTNLSEKDQGTYETRRDNIIAYLDDKALKAGIKKLPCQEIHRLLDRCLKKHPDKKIWGFRALVPGVRMKEYERTAPSGPMGIGTRGGRAGSMKLFFKRFPDLVEAAEKEFTAHAEKDKELNVIEAASDIHQTFITHCEARMIQQRIAAGESEHDAKQNVKLEYPFNTEDCLLTSFTNHLQRLYDTMPYQTIKGRHGDDAAMRYSSDVAIEKPEKITRPYQSVSIDAYQIIANFWFPKVEDMRYGERENFVVRPWLLAMVEDFTDAVLAIQIVLAKEPNRWDALRLIKKALIPWTPMQFTLEGLAYSEGAGMPSGLIKGCEYAIWTELRIDNALAFLAEDVRRAVKKVTGGIVNDGTAKRPGKRNHAERLFAILQEYGFDRIPNSVGIGPQDPRRNLSAEAAFTYKIGRTDLFELTEYLATDHNARSYRKRGGMSALDKLRLYAATEHIPMLDDLGKLVELNPYVEATVRGNKKTGRRPYIDYMYERYGGPCLLYSHVGEKVILRPDWDGLHKIPVYLKEPKGLSLGKVIAKSSKWQKPHTIEQRCAWARKGAVGVRGDKIPAYREGLRGRRNKPAIDELDHEPKPITSTQEWLARPDDLGTFEV